VFANCGFAWGKRKKIWQTFWVSHTRRQSATSRRDAALCIVMSCPFLQERFVVGSTTSIARMLNRFHIHLNEGISPLAAHNVRYSASDRGREWAPSRPLWSSVPTAGCGGRTAAAVRLRDQISIRSAMLSASSSSTPRYRTVLSTLVCPRRSCTARRLPVFR
jgi:hypothetical protein